MIGDAKDFIRDWVAEHVSDEGYQPSDDASRAREIANQLRRNAISDGYTDRQIDEAVDDMVGGGNGLVTYISNAMEAATDAAVDEAVRNAD